MMSKTKEAKKKFDSDYFLDQIIKINENLLSLTKSIEKVVEDIDRINENSNFACEQLEELRPTIDTIRGRLGL